ncbi:siroheme decarboxylase subunit beta [Tindallia californiensis]|uniref:siroheme decarboxylase n=1 Tax=Tindallia californiensis TaxID=159292 RepID=A0A1H3MLX2_9FIRM|nr:Lrp/AsnC family transcriptional regulator [Tindallia californiensis]SDY77606.1 DNA-binding transcriptional regulator, Lrp family [Tindallia californiensis]
MILTSLDKKIIRRLQEDIPMTATPYADMAQELQITERYLLQRIDAYLTTGILRRLGGVVRHHQLGYQANAMVVWQVPEETIEEVGKKMADHPAVSHCYQRPTLPDFPYNLYTMIHGKQVSDCETIVDELSTRTGIHTYYVLESLQELKKTSMKYFISDITK